MGGKCAGAGRRAHSVSFVRPSGSAHRRSSESPSSGARLIGDDRAGRAYHRSWSHTEACRRTAARMRALRSTCRPMQWRRPPCEAGTRAVKKGGTKSLSENSSEKTILSMTAQSTARTCAVALRHSLDLRPVHLDRWLALGHILVHVRDHARRRDVLDSRTPDVVAVHSAARLRLEDGEAAQGEARRHCIPAWEGLPIAVACSRGSGGARRASAGRARVAGEARDGRCAGVW